MGEVDKPLNVVVKLFEIEGMPCVKISDGTEWLSNGFLCFPVLTTESSPDVTKVSLTRPSKGPTLTLMRQAELGIGGSHHLREAQVWPRKLRGQHTQGSRRGYLAIRIQPECSAGKI
jgi:hypothetical protein